MTTTATIGIGDTLNVVGGDTVTTFHEGISKRAPASMRSGDRNYSEDLEVSAWGVVCVSMLMSVLLFFSHKQVVFESGDPFIPND